MKFSDYVKVESKNNPNATLIYGLPKTGKSTLALTPLFTDPSVNLHWFDTENGGALLTRLLKGKPEAERLFYYNILDDVKNPNAAKIYPHVLSGKPLKFCNAHSKVNCGDCARLPPTAHTIFDASKLDPQKDIIVFDSASQFSDSIKNQISLEQPNKQKFEFDDWAKVGIKIAAFLSAVQVAKLPVIVIAHTEGMKDEDDIEKFFPTIGTRNFAPKVSKYFAHVIYTKLTNNKYTAISSATNNARIPAGTRSDLKMEQGGISLLDLFKNSAPPSNGVANKLQAKK